MTTEQLNIIVPAITTIAGATIGAAISYLVGRQQFKATVVSANRQAWINTLRDCIAEYQSSVSRLVRHLIIDKNEEKFDLKTFSEKVDQLDIRKRKIELLINPKEEDHRKMVDLILKMQSTITDQLKKSAGDKSKINFNDLAIEIKAVQRELTNTTQAILKKEWNRVKRGN